ncbi:MAG TPA: hypothetical protein VFK07_00360 [Candidatus Paceibacterota bacterium]|nr:hypothetical protein [Candidatus Paceibacterota bacterium]
MIVSLQLFLLKDATDMNPPVGRFVSLRDFAPRDPEFFKRLAAVQAKDKREVERQEEIALATQLYNEIMFLARPPRRRIRLMGDAVDILLILIKERRSLVAVDYLHLLLQREVLFPESRTAQVLEALRRIMRTR